CEVLCNGTAVLFTSDPSPQVTVSVPQLTGTPQGGTRCGPGVVGLSATAPAGTYIKWYEDPTGGLPFATGPNVNSPYVATTTDFYVAPSIDMGPASSI